jgi:hypothetical protein
MRQVIKMGLSRMRLSSLAIISMLAATNAARADDPAEPKPWSVGVTTEQKAMAQEHLDKGNALFLEHKYSEALEEYRQAVSAWNHPAIRFNMVRSLIFLEKTLEAAEELKQALAYGAAPFQEPAIYSEALGYEKLLAGRVGEIEIACEQAGVEMTLDGAQLTSCPGHEQRRVLPGHHQIVGKKAGFVPRTVEVVVLGGDQQHAAVLLDPLSKAARIEHKWPTWIPWTVFGGGFALAGLGGLLHLKAAADNSSYANNITMLCSDTPGCRSSMLDHSLETSAHIENAIALGMIAVGAAAVTTGSVMLYINRGHTVYDLGKETTTVGVEGRF